MSVTDTVYVVLEDGVGEMSRPLRAFDNPEAANNYVEHPANAGHLFVEQMSIDSEYPPANDD